MFFHRAIHFMQQQNHKPQFKQRKHSQHISRRDTHTHTNGHATLMICSEDTYLNHLLLRVLRECSWQSTSNHHILKIVQIQH